MVLWWRLLPPGLHACLCLCKECSQCSSSFFGAEDDGKGCEWGEWVEVASSSSSECRAGCDGVVGHLQGFPALAAVWIVGLGSVAGIVLTCEHMTSEEADPSGKYRSGEARQTLLRFPILSCLLYDKRLIPDFRTADSFMLTVTPSASRSPSPFLYDNDSLMTQVSLYL